MKAALPLIAAGASMLYLSGCGAKTEATVEGKPAPKPVASNDLKELKKEDVVIGKGSRFPNNDKAVEAGDKVWVIYTGKLANGHVFDSNDKPDGKPFSFTVGRGTVIKGWDLGIPGMKIGGLRKLSIPSNLAYGGQGSEDIPANSPLFFDVKLIDLVKQGEEGYEDRIDQKAGSGPEVKNGDSVTVDYDVKLISGKVVDSAKDHGGPLTFKVGSGQAVKAIDVGITGMKEGGVRELRLPPGLSLGNAQNIPPASVLYVTIRMLKVRPA
jgi:peptidylprolyl isomerase